MSLGIFVVICLLKVSFTYTIEMTEGGEKIKHIVQVADRKSVV